MKYFTIAILAFSLNAFAQTPVKGLAGILVTNPYAQPDNICSGQTVQLFAIPGGGSNDYTYTWTSDPAGFSSDIQNPVVTPRITTKYKVDVNDGTNISTGNVTVVVKEAPEIKLVPIAYSEIRIISANEIGVCAYDSVVLDPGNPDYLYHWSNGSINQTIVVQTSGITYDFQKYNVTATDPSTGCFDSDTMAINFTFSDCSYGINQNKPEIEANFYPNPSSDGIFNYSTNKLHGDLSIEIYNAQGILIRKSKTNADKIRNSIYDLSDQPKGIYFLKATHKNGVIQQKLIIR